MIEPGDRWSEPGQGLVAEVGGSVKARCGPRGGVKSRAGCRTKHNFTWVIMGRTVF